MISRQLEFDGGELTIRECREISEFDECIRLQQSVFGYPDLEVSPRRHLIVSRKAGGWTLGAFFGERLAGFVHQMVGIRDSRIFGYSHMLAVDAEYQNRGIGARLKWAQRERALAEGCEFIMWTWDPMQARNAHFNLNRLGAATRSYAVNFYGSDYDIAGSVVNFYPEETAIASDRLFAEWPLRSTRVEALATGKRLRLKPQPEASIRIPGDWNRLKKENRTAASDEQQRARREFLQAFEAGLVCAGFKRDESGPEYLLYKADRQSE